jgi:hypothetical protein
MARLEPRARNSEDEAVRRMAASDVLFGFALDDPMLPLEDEDREEDDVIERGADAAYA